MYACMCDEGGRQLYSKKQWYDNLGGMCLGGREKGREGGREGGKEGREKITGGLALASTFQTCILQFGTLSP